MDAALCTACMCKPRPHSKHIQVEDKPCKSFYPVAPGLTATNGPEVNAIAMTSLSASNSLPSKQKYL